jgi:hypothetical protein
MSLSTKKERFFQHLYGGFIYAASVTCFCYFINDNRRQCPTKKSGGVWKLEPFCRA